MTTEDANDGNWLSNWLENKKRQRQKRKTNNRPYSNGDFDSGGNQSDHPVNDWQGEPKRDWGDS